MKKLYSLLFLVLSSVSFAQTFYSENMGTPNGNTLIADYVTGTAPATFQNAAPITYTGTADVRTSLASSGYNGASAGGNVFINAVDEFFQIDGINSSAYNSADIQLTFGVNTPSAVTNVLVVEVSTNGGGTWTPITYTPTGTGWTLATIAGGVIPSSTTLSIRFKSTTTLQYRLDDIKLTSVSASCTLSLGAVTTACSATTLNLDAYSVTIPYTGGGNATYVITPSSGTVGGDNPTSVASGNIVISGITEGTNFTVTVTGGTCNLSASANSPECKPVLNLPYTEPFNYTTGSSLGQSQQWSNANTGDNITIANGGLSYPGITSVGNSITFGADGIDCFSPIVPTTSNTIYYSYLLNISSMAGVTDANGGYFSGFGSNNTTLGATLWAKRVEDNSFNLGIEVRTANAANTTYATDVLNAGQTYFVVVGYTFNPDAADDVVKLWVNPVLNGSSEPAATLTDSHTGSDLASVSTFFFRQDSATETGAIQVDELRIGTTWAHVTSGTLGTKDNTIAGLKMYPNPSTTGNLFIETAINAEKNIAIYDVLGKEVLNVTSESNNINISTINSGVYVVKITEEGKTATKKLVIK